MIMNGQEQGNAFNCSVLQLSRRNADNNVQKELLEFYQDSCNKKTAFEPSKGVLILAKSALANSEVCNTKLTVISSSAQYILIPSASLVLKCHLRVALDAPKNSIFFIGWQKVNAQQKWNITKLYAFQFTSGPNGCTFTGALYENKTNHDHFLSIRRHRKMFRVTKAKHRLQRCHSRL